MTDVSVAPVASTYRVIKVFGVNGQALATTSISRAIELLSKGRAEWDSTAPDQSCLRLLSEKCHPPSEEPSAESNDKKGGRKRRRVVATLRKRDGDDCFYCIRPMAREDMTLEHLLSLRDGGTNCYANLVLACGPCNHAAGHLAVIEKVKLRERTLLHVKFPTTIVSNLP
ncbi:HNH endonuclease [Pseudomonas veronii]|uniref:HNH endonuclease n=1 Tax=Pseudomonas veronii TaxID=76761 RepID=UPI00398BB579